MQFGLVAHSLGVRLFFLSFALLSFPYHTCAAPLELDEVDRDETDRHLPLLKPEDRLSKQAQFSSYLVTFRERHTPRVLEELRESLADYRGVEITPLSSFTVKLSGPDTLAVQKAARRVEERGQAMIEPNFAVTTLIAGPVASPTPRGAAPVSPTPTPAPTTGPDPDAPLWYTDATRVFRHPQSTITGPVAFDETTGNSNFVTIHTVDTTLDYYEFRHPSELRKPSKHVELSGSSSGSLPHGSFVSYIAHGEQNNGRESHGVCPGCDRKAYTFDFSDTSSLENVVARLSDVIVLFDSLRESIDRPFNIVNMSWGLPFSSPSLQAAMIEAEERGVHMVAAVGNENQDRPLYPAEFSQVIAVGASGVDDGQGGVNPNQRALFTYPNGLTGGSNLGPDIVAPGYKIPIPDFSRNQIRMDPDGFGTSFAAPHVSGALGLLWSYFAENIQLFPQIVDLFEFAPDGTPMLGQMVRYMREVLEQGATDIAEPGHDEETGHGLINLANSMNIMRSDGMDFANQISPGLSHGVQEWNGTFGGSVLARLQQRLVSTPETKFILNQGPVEYGSCWQSDYNYIKTKISRPRFITKINNFSLTPLSHSGDKVRVKVAYDLELSGYARLRIETVVQCVLGLPDLHGTFNLNWTPTSGTGTTVDEIELTLDKEQYKVTEVRRVSTVKKELQYSAQLGGSIALSKRFYEDYTADQLAEAELFFRDVLEPTLDQDLATMTERMVNATLFQERAKPFKYFEGRAFGSTSGSRETQLRLRGVSRETRFTHAPGESRSTFAVANPAPLGFDFPKLNPTVLSNAPMSFIPAALDSASIVGNNTFNAQLAYLYDAGAFAQPGMTSATAITGTTLFPSGLSLSFTNVSLEAIPSYSTYTQPYLGAYGSIVFSLSSTLGIDTGGYSMSTPAYITWIVPVRLRDLHKEIINETETALIPAEYEQRLVPDFGNALAVVVPSLPGNLYDYITDAELGAAFTFMLGTKFLRPVSALSSHRMGGDALLGNKWGCIEQVLSMINFYSRIANKPDLVEHEYSKNCFDLNIGYLRPADFELAGSVGDHVTRPTNIELRAQIPPPTIAQLPDLQALAPQRFDEYNHNGHIYRAAYVSIPLRPGTNSDEVNYSFNGLFRVAYEAQHPVTLVEQLWQWSPGKIWVPNNGTNYKLLGLAREGDQLVVSKTCNQHVGVQFEYDGLTPPTITQREAGPIVETTVFESTDTWTFQNCNVRANDLEEGPRDILGEIEHGIGPASSYLIVPPSNSSTQY